MSLLLKVSIVSQAVSSRKCVVYCCMISPKQRYFKIEATANDETHHFVIVYICDGSFIYALSVMHRIEGISTKFLKFAELWLMRNSFFIFNQNSIK